MNNDYSGLQMSDVFSNTTSTHAEQRLWSAVVIMLLIDYERLLQQISFFAKKGKVNLLHLQDLEAMRREAYHEWFSIICEFINIDVSHILTKLEKLDKEYRVAQVTFTDAADLDYYYLTNGTKQKRTRK